MITSLFNVVCLILIRLLGLNRRELPIPDACRVSAHFPLPDELLEIIFGYLAYDHQVRSRRVCRRWRRILQSPFMQRHIILRNLFYPIRLRAPDKPKGWFFATKKRHTLTEYADCVCQSVFVHWNLLKVIIFDGGVNLASRLQPTPLPAIKQARLVRETTDREFETVFARILDNLLTFPHSFRPSLKFTNTSLAKLHMLNSVFQKRNCQILLHNSLLLLSDLSESWRVFLAGTFLSAVEQHGNCCAILEGDYILKYFAKWKELIKCTDGEYLAAFKAPDGHGLIAYIHVNWPASRFNLLVYDKVAGKSGAKTNQSHPETQLLVDKLVTSAKDNCQLQEMEAGETTRSKNKNEWEDLVSDSPNLDIDLSESWDFISSYLDFTGENESSIGDSIGSNRSRSSTVSDDYCSDIVETSDQSLSLGNARENFSSRESDPVHNASDNCQQNLTVSSSAQQQINTTLQSVEAAIETAFGDQISTWTACRNLALKLGEIKSQPEVPVSTVIQTVNNHNRDNFERSQKFASLLRGMDQLDTWSQSCTKVPWKSFVYWMIHHAPFLVEQDSSITIGQQQYHYSLSWMEKISDLPIYGFIFVFCAIIRSMELTQVERYLLMVVIMFEPDDVYSSERSPKISVLHRHYADVLLASIKQRVSTAKQFAIIGRKLESFFGMLCVVNRLYDEHVSVNSRTEQYYIFNYDQRLGSVVTR